MKAGWDVKPLGEVCRLINGRAYKQAELLEMGQYPVLRVGNFFTNNHWYYSDLELDADKYCDNGDLLYAWSASFGPRIWQGGKVIYHYHIWKVAPDLRRLDRDYLYYFFDWDKELIKKEQGAGTTMIHVSKGSMEARTVPLPPLEEQQRIVAILDEAFEGLARARAHAEANLQNARELFDLGVDALLSANRDDWQVGSLSRLVGPVATGPFGSLLHKSDYVENQTPLVNPANIVGGRIVPDQRKTVNRAALDRLSSYVLTFGDIVVGRRGEMGRCAVVEEDQAGWLCGTGSFFIRPNCDALSKFVAHILRSPSFVEKLESLSTGATMANLSNRVLGDIEIALPNMNKQAELLEVIEGLEKATNHLEVSYKSKLQSLESLRQSLLQKAFAGELT